MDADRRSESGAPRESALHIPPGMGTMHACRGKTPASERPWLFGWFAICREDLDA